MDVLLFPEFKLAHNFFIMHFTVLEDKGEILEIHKGLLIPSPNH